METSSRSCLVIFLVPLIFNMGLCYLPNDNFVNVVLEHSLDVSNPEKFSFRGNVSIPSLNSGLFNKFQEVLSATEQNSLKILARNNDFYRLRATISYANGYQSTFITSNKACRFIKAKLNDLLWFAVDGNGFVTAVTHSSPSDQYNCVESDFTHTLKKLETDVIVRHTEFGPVPDTASFIQKIEREREAREKGEVRDNRGFLAKYWMYILPVVLLVFISGATNQEQK